MVTRFPLIAAPIVELNIQLMKILVLNYFCEYENFLDSNFMILILGYLHEVESSK